MSYRFVLRPRWIVSHVIVLALVLTMVNLGLWQLRRLDERQARNAVVSERLASPPVPLVEILDPASDAAAVAAVADRRVTVNGAYEPDDQVLVRSRSLDGSPGSWVLTPLRLEDGSLVVVNRGWIPNNGTFDAVPPAYVPADGDVRVQGLVQESQERGRFGPTDPASGRLTSLARVDVARYARQLEGPVRPGWVQLRSERPEPAGSNVPVALGPPELDEGSHFSYAMQWFIFATIGAVGYPLILRRNARDRAGVEPEEPDEPELPHETGVLADGRA